jgi:hypothetical protein
MAALVLVTLAALAVAVLEGVGVGVALAVGEVVVVLLPALLELVPAAVPPDSAGAAAVVGWSEAAGAGVAVSVFTDVSVVSAAAPGARLNPVSAA